MAGAQRTPGSDLRKLAAQSAAKRTRFRGRDMSTAIAMIGGAIAFGGAVLWIAMKAGQSIDDMDAAAKKWRIGHD